MAKRMKDERKLEELLTELRLEAQHLQRDLSQAENRGFEVALCFHHAQELLESSRAARRHLVRLSGRPSRSSKEIDVLALLRTMALPASKEPYFNPVEDVLETADEILNDIREVFGDRQATDL